MEKKNNIRVNKIFVKNYKGIDNLELTFSKPQMEDDFDVTVMGSKNGLGKTSVLECCSLLFTSLLARGPRIINSLNGEQLNSLIKAGEKAATIEGEIEINSLKYRTSLKIVKDREVIFNYSPEAPNQILSDFEESYRNFEYVQYDYNEILINSLLSLTANPFIVAPFLSYFHSHRRISNRNPDLKSIVQSNSYIMDSGRLEEDYMVNFFKQNMLLLIMSQGGLIEGLDKEESNEALKTLNNLIATYAGCKVSKLKPGYDNSLDLRVAPLTGEGSFSFDGLSSGQKEIISTLFLIWKNSRNFSGIVLIDDPELHLNAEWHRSFFNKLEELAPHNQYIIATHSETIFSSADLEHCIILKKD